MTILLGLIKLLGSAGFGTIFGGLMGIVNRRLDLQAEKQKQEHELAMRDKDAAIMAQEWAARTQVAQIESAAVVEKAGFEALAKSYDFAKPEAGSRMEAFSSFIRPFISLSYFVVTSFGAGFILYYAFEVRKVSLTADQWYDLVMYVIAWVAFMGGATIGWWYAIRPGGKPPVLALR